MGRGTVDAQGYPGLWHDIQPDMGDGKARTAEGLVNDPHGSGVKGYVVSNCKNVTFQDLILLRSSYWTSTVSNTDGYTSRNIKIISRKKQYHDDAYDLTGGSKHILIENGFAMTMDDAFAFYGGAGAGLEDVVVKGFRGLRLHLGFGPRVWLYPGGQARALRGRELRFDPEQVRHLDSIHARLLYRTGVSHKSEQQAAVGRFPLHRTARGSMTAGRSTSTAGIRP